MAECAICCDGGRPSLRHDLLNPSKSAGAGGQEIITRSARGATNYGEKELRRANGYSFWRRSRLGRRHYSTTRNPRGPHPSSPVCVSSHAQGPVPHWRPSDLTTCFRLREFVANLLIQRDDPLEGI